MYESVLYKYNMSKGYEISFSHVKVNARRTSSMHNLLILGTDSQMLCRATLGSHSENPVYAMSVSEVSPVMWQ